MDKLKCPICLIDINENNKKLDCYCKKSYHKDCINKWLEISNNCPCCRYKLKKKLILNESDIFILFYLFLLFIMWCNILNLQKKKYKRIK